MYQMYVPLNLIKSKKPCVKDKKNYLDPPKKIFWVRPWMTDWHWTSNQEVVGRSNSEQPFQNNF